MGYLWTVAMFKYFMSCYPSLKKANKPKRWRKFLRTRSRSVTSISSGLNLNGFTTYLLLCTSCTAASTLLTAPYSTSILVPTPRHSDTNWRLLFKNSASPNFGLFIFWNCCEELFASGRAMSYTLLEPFVGFPFTQCDPHSWEATLMGRRPRLKGDPVIINNAMNEGQQTWMHNL